MFTLNDFAKFKQEQKKITMVTAYDYFSAQILAESGIDTILVGDSLGMVINGEKNTLKVTVEQIIYHASSVRKGAAKTFIVADMPYLSYHIDIATSIKNAGKIMIESGCDAIKIEVNNIETLEHIRAILAAQIPVIAHIGMTPQSVNLFGGFKTQGKSVSSKEHILALAEEITQSGVSALVLECIPENLTKQISQDISIATIGIGAGKYCDGQVLVFHDMLGFNPQAQTKFVKKYADTYEYFSQGIKEYIKDVKNGNFPSQEHTY